MSSICKKARGSRRGNPKNMRFAIRASASRLVACYFSWEQRAAANYPRMARNPLADRPDRAMIVSACLSLLEKLHSPLVLLRRRARGKCPQIPTLPRLCILLPRVKPVLSRLYFSNHAKEDAVALDRVVGNKQGPGKAL